MWLLVQEIGGGLCILPWRRMGEQQLGQGCRQWVLEGSYLVVRLDVLDDCECEGLMEDEGGLSHVSNEHGFGCDNVVEYEVS